MTSLVPENLTTLTEAATALRIGETTSTELVSECLERIEKHDGQLQAFVSVQASEARARAAELDARAEAGRLAGPLHGIPVAIKDIIDIPAAVGKPAMSTESVAATTGRLQPAAADAALVTRPPRNPVDFFDMGKEEDWVLTGAYVDPKGIAMTAGWAFRATASTTVTLRSTT